MYKSQGSGEKTQSKRAACEGRLRVRYGVIEKIGDFSVRFAPKDIERIFHLGKKRDPGGSLSLPKLELAVFGGYFGIFKIEGGIV